MNENKITETEKWQGLTQTALDHVNELYKKHIYILQLQKRLELELTKYCEVLEQEISTKLDMQYNCMNDLENRFIAFKLETQRKLESLGEMMSVMFDKN